jgi:hypothetical protein
VKAGLPTAAPGDAGMPLVSTLAFFLARGSKRGEQELREVARGDAEDRGLLVDQLLLHHVAGDLHRGDAGALAGARLEHVERAALDRELDVLHVLVVLLELVLDLQELL